MIHSSGLGSTRSRGARLIDLKMCGTGTERGKAVGRLEREMLQGISQEPDTAVTCEDGGSDESCICYRVLLLVTRHA